MPLFNVVLYAVFHTNVDNVEAANEKEAIEKACEVAWSTLTAQTRDMEFAESVEQALVDPVGGPVTDTLWAEGIDGWQPKPYARAE